MHVSCRDAGAFSMDKLHGFYFELGVPKIENALGATGEHQIGEVVVESNGVDLEEELFCGFIVSIFLLVGSK